LRVAGVTDREISTILEHLEGANNDFSFLGTEQEFSSSFEHLEGDTLGFSFLV
jgi:hypothetical protein